MMVLLISLKKHLSKTKTEWSKINNLNSRSTKCTPIGFKMTGFKSKQAVKHIKRHY